MFDKLIANAGKTVAERAQAAGKAVADGAQTAGKAVMDSAQVAGKTIADGAQAAGKAVSDGAQVAGNAVQNASKQLMSPEQMQELFDTCYQKAVDGVPGASKPIDELASDYLSKHETVEEAAKDFIGMQLLKCTTSGAISAAAGFLTLPATLAAIPANIANVIYVQTRMVAGLAKMGGYDIRNDKVQTLIYVCLAGNAANEILKDAGIKIGVKFAEAGIKKIPFEVIKKINAAVSFRLVTKFGEKGLINLGKLIPLAGIAIGGSFDFVTTKIIADNAYKHFIDGRVENVVEECALDALAEA